MDAVDSVVCSSEVEATVVSTSDGFETEQETEKIAKNAENKEQSIIVLESYLNTDVLSTEEKLKALGLNPVVIGDGKYVVNQYPNKKSHVLKGSKVFLKTESQNITMPDVTNWSENEITTFCNFIGLKYTLNGSGHVTSISIPAGSVIDLSTIVEINLTK